MCYRLVIPFCMLLIFCSCLELISLLLRVFSVIGVDLQHDLKTLQKRGIVILMSKIIKFPRVKDFMRFWFQAHSEHLNSLID